MTSANVRTNLGAVRDTASSSHGKLWDPVSDPFHDWGFKLILKREDSLEFVNIWRTVVSKSKE